jgi:catechol-2,3-dioxygenase
MLKINGIDHININVKDLRKSIDFYKEVFGFQIMEEGTSSKSGAPYAIIGESQKAMLAIYETANLQGPTTLNHIGFNIKNFKDVVAVVEKLNIKTPDYGMIDYPSSQSLYIFDPDDNEIELSSVFAGGL